MDRNIPLPGALYKRDGERVCQIICIAKNYEDEKEMAVYQEMFPPFSIWSEPLEKFVEETDEKYFDSGTGSVGKSGVSDVESTNVSENISDSIVKESLINGTAERILEGKIPDKEIAQRGFMELLDAESYHEKYLIFTGLKKYIDKRLLNNIAVALDIVLDDGDEEEQYESILHCLQTFERYETRRLR